MAYVIWAYCFVFVPKSSLWRGALFLSYTIPLLLLVLTVSKTEDGYAHIPKTSNFRTDISVRYSVSHIF